MASSDQVRDSDGGGNEQRRDEPAAGLIKQTTLSVRRRRKTEERTGSAKLRGQKKGQQQISARLDETDTRGVGGWDKKSGTMRAEPSSRTPTQTMAGRSKNVSATAELCFAHRRFSGR